MGGSGRKQPLVDNVLYQSRLTNLAFGPGLNPDQLDSTTESCSAIKFKLIRTGRVVVPGSLGGIGAHALRATAVTKAPDHLADIAEVQEWLGHANIETTRIYDLTTARRGRRTVRRSRWRIGR